MLTAAIARYLDTKGHGTFNKPNSTIGLEELPPGDGISVAFKTAPPAELGGYDKQGIQIVVRRTTGGRARAGYDAAQAIRDDLDGLRSITLGEGTVDETVLVWLLADDNGPLNLGDDSNGIPRWSLRFTALTPHATPLTVGA